MNILKKTTSFVVVALFGVVTSMVAPILMTTAQASGQLTFEPNVKNISVAGSGYSDSNVSNVATGDTVRFRIKVNNTSGAPLDKVTVRENLSKVSGTTGQWVLDSQAETTVGANTTSVTTPVSVFLQNDVNLQYVVGSTKVSVNGAEPQAVSDVNNTSPLLNEHGFVFNNYPVMTTDPQTWLYFDVQAITGTPVNPQINVQFDKQFMNVTKGTGWSKTITADAGDIIKARIWFHNGGITGAADKPVTGVVIKDSMPFNPQNDFVNTATFYSNEVGPLTSTAKFTVSSVQGVSYVAGSTNLVVPTSTSNDSNVLFNTGRRQNIPDVNGTSALMSSTGFQFGTLQYCWEFQRFVEFEVQVASVTPVTGQVLSAKAPLPNTGVDDLVMIGSLGTVISGLYLRKFKFWL